MLHSKWPLLLACAFSLIWIRTAQCEEEGGDLVSRLKSDQPKDVRLAAAKALMRMEKPPVEKSAPILRAWLKEKDSDFRAAALESLTVELMLTKGECPVEALELMFDKVDSVRWNAATCVSCLDKFPKTAAPLLLRAATHEDRAVRDVVPRALVRAAREHRRTVPVLMALTRDKDMLVQAHAFEALFDATQDFDLVVPYWLRTDESYQRSVEEHKSVQNGARRKDPELESVPPLEYAKKLLEEYGKKEPEKLGNCLIKLLKDKSPVIRRGASRTLGAMAADEKASKEVLRTLSASQAIEKLEDDSDESVRAAAKAALTKLR